MCRTDEQCAPLSFKDAKNLYNRAFLPSLCHRTVTKTCPIYEWTDKVFYAVAFLCNIPL